MVVVAGKHDPAPLDGYRVVSLAEQFPGPLASLLLGDLGAEVVQVEKPGTGDPSRAYPSFYSALNRGKRSVAIDLKHPDGVSAVHAMVAQADILLEGFRPGVLDRLGLSAETLTGVNSGLVYVSISGFGQTGPYRDFPGHDLSYQAMAGLLTESQAERGELPILTLADLTSGLFAAIAALTGLAGRVGNSGRGGRYDVAMFDSLVALLTTILVPAANGAGTTTIGLDPGYGYYATSDQRWIAVSIPFEDYFWQRLCVALEIPNYGDIPGTARVERRHELRTHVAHAVAHGTAAHWQRVLGATGVPFGVVESPSALLGDPQVLSRGLFQRLGDAVYLRQPLIVDGRPLGPRSGWPQLGEHTVEVLRETGLSQNRINHLLAEGIAAQYEPAR